MKKDITKHRGDNLGGVHSFKFSYAETIDEIPPVFEGAVRTEVTLAFYPPARWYDGYCTEGTMKFTDLPQESDDGPYFEKEFSGSVPKDRPELVALFNSLLRRPLVLEITYNNGCKKLVGNKQEPLFLLPFLDTGEDVAKKNGYKIVIKGTGTELSPFYEV